MICLHTFEIGSIDLKTKELIDSKTHSSLTSCIFLIACGCVLFDYLGDWAGKLVAGERKSKFIGIFPSRSFQIA